MTNVLGRGEFIRRKSRPQKRDEERAHCGGVCRRVTRCLNRAIARRRGARRTTAETIEKVLNSGKNVVTLKKNGRESSSSYTRERGSIRNLGGENFLKGPCNRKPSGRLYPLRGGRP